MRRRLLSAFAPSAFALLAATSLSLLPDGNDDGTGGGGDSGQGDQPPKPSEVKQFSQADLDRVISSKVAEMKLQQQKQLDQFREEFGKSETEKLQLERDRAQKERDDVVRASVQRVSEAEAKAQAMLLGGKDERIMAIVRMADLTQVADEAGVVDTEKVRSAVTKVLLEYPEWTRGAGQPAPEGQQQGQAAAGAPPAATAGATRSGGDLSTKVRADITLDDFKKLSYSQRVELQQARPDVYQKMADAELSALRA